MAKLLYSAITSLDGYIEDANGAFEWAMPSDEAHAFINGLERGVGTYLFGRRMYETMAGWETDPELAASSDIAAEFAESWRAADKVVYSRTLDAVWTERTRLERSFDAHAVQALKASATLDMAVGGAALAASAFHAGLVDECHLFVAPVVVGGGKRALPDGVFLPLSLVDHRRFESGMVYLRYRMETDALAEEVV